MTDTIYTARDGSRWVLRDISPPIPDRSHDWEATPEDYGGPGDVVLYGRTRDAVIAEVEEHVTSGIGYVSDDPTEGRGLVAWLAVAFLVPFVALAVRAGV